MARPLIDLAGLNVSAEDFLGAVLETVAQPVWVVDPEGGIRFANPAAIATLGYDEADELLGRQSHETTHYKHPDGSPYPAADCPMLLPRATGETVSRDLDWFVRRDGSMFPVSYVAAPLAMPEGRGAVVAFTDAGDRLHGEQLRRQHEAVLVEQLASLRRVAAIVAEATAADVFATIAREAAQLLRMPGVHIWRYEHDGTGTVMGAWGEQSDPFQPGTNWPFETPSVSAYVHQIKAGRPARLDDSAEVAGVLADAVRTSGIRSAIGAPIVVGGEVWGMITASTVDPEPLPEDVDDRLADFTELVATAIANAESRAGLARLAQEQAALRRVATLVAKESPPAAVFAKVVDELANVFDEAECLLLRDEGDGTASVVASRGTAMSTAFPVGTRLPTDGDSVTATVLREGRPHRVDDYSTATGTIAERAHQHGARSAVGCPIRVGGRIWGAMGTLRYEDEPFPAGTETRVAEFADLVATAIANAAARTEVERLADEQAALRRVATLVAQGAPPFAVFDAAAAQMERLLDADHVMLSRYEGGDEVTVLAHRGASAEHVRPGSRVSLEGLEGQSVTAMVRRTGRPARIDRLAGTHAPMAQIVRALGTGVAVGAPIVVDGRLWGVIVARWVGGEPSPADTEERMAQFAQLLDTAIANADSRDQLTASRARLLTAADEARRRVVRDLHDGAQQRQVHTIMTLKLAQQALRSEDGDAESLVAEALEQAEQGNVELRELAHGMLPFPLTRGGLRAGVDTVVARLDLPVDVDVPDERFPAAIEASAYFIVAEALTNVAKHAHAERASVTAYVEDGTLRVRVRDDGIGGARPEGSGLLGLADRLAVLDGQLRVDSPADGGTLVAADIPVPTSPVGCRTRRFRP